MLKTGDQVKEEFLSAGRSIAEWARERGFNPNIVYGVLRGERRAIRGQAHAIAVSLGMKKGTLRSSVHTSAVASR
jgi:gp16 family phage-associated protein